MSALTVERYRYASGLVEIVIKSQGATMAVISRQCRGGKWCLYRAGSFRRQERFATCKAAVAAVTEAAASECGDDG